MKPGDAVVIRAFNEVPEHWFRDEEVRDECITGGSHKASRRGSTGSRNSAWWSPTRARAF